MLKKQNEELFLGLSKNEAVKYLICVVSIVAAFFIGILVGSNEEHEFISRREKQAFDRGVQSVKPIDFKEQLENVSKRMKENPLEMKDFLGDSIDIAAKASPSLAMQIEKYASEEVKKEIERWKKDANILNLLRLESDNKTAKITLFDLQEVKKKDSQQIEEMKRRIELLSSENRNFLGLKERFIDLQQRYNKVAARINEEYTKGVPVVLVNTWSSTNAFINIFSEEEESKNWTFFVDPRENKQIVVNIPPGGYKVKFYSGSINYSYGRISQLTVTEHVSVDGKFHGIVMTPP